MVLYQQNEEKKEATHHGLLLLPINLNQIKMLWFVG